MPKTYSYYRIRRRPKRKKGKRKVRVVRYEKKLVSKSGEEEEQEALTMSTHNTPTIFHRRAESQSERSRSEEGDDIGGGLGLGARDVVEGIEDTRTASEAEFERRNFLVTPWGSVDRRGVRLVVQFSLTLILLAFCFWQVATMPANQVGAVWGMIGTFIGFWFDSPNSGGNKK